jgi:hypothetical protein
MTIDATKRFRTSAVGRMVAGATPTSAIAARYADAPAWPTLAYSSAAAKNSAARSTPSGMARP